MQNADYQVRISLQGREVYRSDGGNASIRESYTTRFEFTDHGLTWTILIAPSSNLLSAAYAESSLVVLIIGMLLSIMVAIVVYLASAARIRSAFMPNELIGLSQGNTLTTEFLA
jgi:hypothetical protein